MNIENERPTNAEQRVARLEALHRFAERRRDALSVPRQSNY